MSNARILVVEDEEAVREMICLTLEGAGYETLGAADTEQAERLMADHRMDLILLDWMLPGKSGIEFLHWLKRDEGLCDIPVVMVTARSEEERKVQGLEAGGDDYITKPFSTRELLARIRAVMRRTHGSHGDIIEIEGGLSLDQVQYRLAVNGEAVEIGPTEYRLLQFFMTHPDRVYSRSQLLDRVWGRNVYIEERTVDVHIRRLRKVLEPSGHDRLVQTVRGVGYRFSVQP